MSIRIAINGFGRMGRLGLRAAWDWPQIEFVGINDVQGDAAGFAHLLAFDSVHGRWDKAIGSDGEALLIDGKRIPLTHARSPEQGDWSGVDIVLECSGKFKTRAALAPYFAQGVRKVVVSAPVPQSDALNIVMGVNDERYDPQQHDIVTAASCTTNCLAPIVKVLHESIGIKHGTITTIHDITNTQTIIDAPHKDWRRARANSLSLIPTSTGSAKAIGMIFPQLNGKLDGLAIRVPLLNASLTDCVFEVERPTTVDEINQLFKTAASSPSLQGILGYEERPLVSIDYKTDPRSAIFDALSTLVTNGTQVKILAWYDNEWGYANRLLELARKVAQSLH
ncbi:MAG: ArsJ-associated glyceraldehyde-3-phosphate dehydrogenase [Gammaproteobacteria bacterium]